jgi:hypothetical protein
VQATSARRAAAPTTTSTPQRLPPSRQSTARAFSDQMASR